MSEISKNDRADKIMGKRPSGVAIDEPCELGYHCPVCKYDHFIGGDEAGDYDERLYWSEYNGFVWCSVCNKDYPSALCLCLPDDIDEAIDVFLSSVEEAVARVAKPVAIVNHIAESRAREPRQLAEVAEIDLSPSSYELLFDEDAGRGIYIAGYRPPRNHGVSVRTGWVITTGDAYLGKTPNAGTDKDYFVFTFDVPHLGSGDFVDNYVWDTAEGAFSFWRENRDRIIATSKEKLLFYEAQRANDLLGVDAGSDAAVGVGR